MKYSKKSACVLLAVTAALLLMSCGASHHVRDKSLDKDPDFGYDMLQGNRMLIAGVSDRWGRFVRENRANVSKMLSNVLIEEMEGTHGIHIVSAGRLVSIMGLDRYEVFMKGCDVEEMFTLDDIRMLDTTVANIEYILLAHIVNENIVTGEAEKVNNNNDGDRIETEYSRNFSLTVDFQLYDVRREKMVWSNVIFNEVDRTETRSTSSGCVEGCIESVITSILFGSPAEISREEVLDEIVERCVQNLKAARR